MIKARSTDYRNISMNAKIKARKEFQELVFFRNKCFKINVFVLQQNNFYFTI